MVFFFVTRGKAVVFMGVDKYENDDLLKYAFADDIWFHVDSVSSAHVYLRPPPGVTIDSIPEEVLEDCLQLVKENSIKGKKMSEVVIDYTRVGNLMKSQNMDTGQVGFLNDKAVKKTHVRRDTTVVNRILKTRTERTVNEMRTDKEQHEEDTRLQKKQDRLRERKEQEEDLKRKKQQADIQAYTSLMKDDKMKTNQTDCTAEEYEEDFM
eukprot:TRINITY_DN18078_c0_g1_i1.p1 TRINITY_DN18078_c0_g1~~TRINITY_DN18078_c0_g1_i1.p1  ORF type:complete len:219 (+),score=87.16 TRINITY_DN18078_c0_g1_i1:32-658(+)